MGTRCKRAPDHLGLAPSERRSGDFYKDRRTRIAHYAGFIMLACGFLLQLVAQLLR